MAKIRTFIGLFLIMCLAIPCLGTVYTVGDSSGWTLGVDYGSWSSSQTFLVGDTLVFNYGSGHTVHEVKQSDYTTCTIGNPINTDNKGITKIQLQTPGAHYFICGVIGHCGSGMKLSVNVLASGSPTVSSPSSTSTITTATGPTIYPTTTTTTPMTIPDSVAASPGKLSPPINGALIIICGIVCSVTVLLLG